MISETFFIPAGHEFFALDPGLLSLAGSPVLCNKIDLFMKPKDPKPGNPTDMMVFARGVSILAQREDLIAVARESGSYQNEILTLNIDFVFKY